MSDDAALAAFDAWRGKNFEQSWNSSGSAKAAFLAGAAWSARAQQEASDLEVETALMATEGREIVEDRYTVVRLDRYTVVRLRNALRRLGLAIVKVGT